MGALGYASRAAAAALILVGAGKVHAQGANCREFLTATQVSANAGNTPHVCAFDSARNSAANTNVRHVLLYDWSNGGHNRGHTQRHMLRLSRDYGFRLDRSQVDNYITAATLQGVDIVVVNNSDGDAFQNSTSLQAMRNFVEVEGGAMFLVHAAAAFVPCPDENLEDPECAWMMRAVRTQFWRHMNHSASSRVRLYADSVRVGEIPPNAENALEAFFASRNPAVPATMNHGRVNHETRMIFEGLPLNGPSGELANRPYIWEGLWDEWFAYRNFPRLEGERIMDGVVLGPINQLISLDETSLTGGLQTTAGCSSPCAMGDRPVSWTRKMGKGLAAYNTAGHGNVYIRSRYVGDSIVNDSLMEKYNWRLMKYLARDFVGCMAPEDANYNPQATVLALTLIDDQCPCAEAANCSVTSVRPGSVSGFTSRAEMEWNAGVLRVSLADPGRHRIRIRDALGRELYSIAAQGGGEVVTIPGLRRGVHFVEVEEPRGGVISERVFVNR